MLPSGSLPTTSVVAGVGVGAMFWISVPLRIRTFFYVAVRGGVGRQPDDDLSLTDGRRLRATGRHRGCALHLLNVP